MMGSLVQPVRAVWCQARVCKMVRLVSLHTGHRETTVSTQCRSLWGSGLVRTKVSLYRRPVAATSSLSVLCKPQEAMVVHVKRCQHTDCQQTPASHIQASGSTDVTSYQASVSGDRKWLQLQHEAGQRLRFSGTWLRYNCHCSLCKQAGTGQNLWQPSTLHPTYTLDWVSLNAEAGVLEVCWVEPEGEGEHIGRFPLTFLEDNDQSPSARQRLQQALVPPYMNANCTPEIRYQEVLESHAGLLKWLQHLNEEGICFVRGVPTNRKDFTEIVERIWPIQRTIYGKTWDVRSVANPINVAYSSVELGFHMDLMYYESPPGLQFLHCVRFDDCVQGGESVFVDSFHVAEELRKRFPEDFQTLERVPVTFQKIHYAREDPVCMKYQRPHIVTRPDGVIVAVNWSPPFEGPLSVAEEDIEPYYRAYNRFSKLLQKSLTMVETRLKPGDMVSFNNRRIMHARRQYTQHSGERHLQGCYINNDEFKTRLAVLRKMCQDEHPVKRVFNQDWS